MRAHKLGARCRPMSQIVALCLVHHGGRARDPTVWNQVRHPDTRLLGPARQCPSPRAGDRDRSAAWVDLLQSYSFGVIVGPPV